MRSGQRRHYITFQQSTSAPDGYGGQVKTWHDAGNAWVGITPLSGRQLVAAQAINNEITHRIDMNYRPGITADKRIVFGDRHFDILAVLNIEERNKDLQLMCSEGLADG